MQKKFILESRVQTKYVDNFYELKDSLKYRTDAVNASLGILPDYLPNKEVPVQMPNEIVKSASYTYDFDRMFNPTGDPFYYKKFVRKSEPSDKDFRKSDQFISNNYQKANENYKRDTQVKNETYRTEPFKAEPPRTEPRRSEPSRAEPFKAEPSGTESYRKKPYITEQYNSTEKISIRKEIFRDPNGSTEVIEYVENYNEHQQPKGILKHNNQMSRSLSRI